MVPSIFSLQILPTRQMCCASMQPTTSGSFSMER